MAACRLQSPGSSATYRSDGVLPVVSPDGRYLYFTCDRSFADKPLEAALSTHEWIARLGGPGSGLGDTWRVPMSAVFEALGRAPRRATPRR